MSQPGSQPTRTTDLQSQATEAAALKAEGGPSWLARLPLLVVCIIGTLIRLYELPHQRLWFDEYLSIRIMREPYSTLLGGAYGIELNPPGYFLLLKGWLALVGETEIMMRVLSAYFGIGTIPLVYLLGARLIHHRVGLAAASLVALHPTYIHYSLEIRMYAAVVFLSLLALLAATYYISKPGRSWLLLLIASGLAALYMHYFAALMLLGIGLYSLAQLIARNDVRHRKVIYALAITALLYLPGSLFLLSRHAYYTNTFHPPPSRLLTFTVVPALLSTETSLRPVQLSPQFYLSLAAVLLGIITLIISRRTALAAWLGSVILLSALISLAISRTGIQIADRYLLHLNALSIVLACCVFTPRQPRLIQLSQLIGVALIALYAGDAYRLVTGQDPRRPNWKYVAAQVESVSRPGEPVVVLGWDAKPVEYYLERTHAFASPSVVEQLAGTGASARSFIIVRSARAPRHSPLIPLLNSQRPLVRLPEIPVAIYRFPPDR